MRYFIKPADDVLTWCLLQDAEPHTVPFMPTQAEQGLVVAHLIGGNVLAEVVLSQEHLTEVCGGAGFPLGRLYFQIPKSALYMVCLELTPAAFGES